MSWDEYDAQKQTEAEAKAFLQKAFQDKFVQAAKPQGITRERALAEILEGVNSMGEHAFKLHSETEDEAEKKALEAAMTTLKVVLVGVLGTTASVHEPLSFAN